MPKRRPLPIWIVPLIIAALVAVFGWWGNLQLRQTIEQQLKSELHSTLEANVTALEIWMTNQTKLATSIAGEPKIQALASAIFERMEGSTNLFLASQERTEQREFGRYLLGRLNKVGYEEAQLVRSTSSNFTVVASAGGPWLVGSPVSEAHTNKYAELFTAGEPVIITPYKPSPPPAGPQRRGRRNRNPPGTNNLMASRDFRSGERPGPPGDRPGPPPNGPRGRRGDHTLMQVAAPVHGTNGKLEGALALIIDPNREFSRILSVANTGESGETYAFDQRGLLISRSRFDGELRTLGLLDPTNATSALNIRLNDPGADPVDGAKPLTYMVASAMAGQDGVEVDDPVRDYRGKLVVGAWRWLPHYGFGVATQIDADEAFRSLHLIKLIFILLFLLLVFCATGMFLFSYANVISRLRLRQAELKLKQLGQYTLEEKIGEGGMGVVYRARHALMRRETAVKLLLPERADEAAIKRFEREVCLTCQLTHPNTIQVYDYGHTPEGVFYYAMEYLRGLNLHDLVARSGPQAEGRVIHILVQVCEALAEAHGMGMVHRDIKPANVFLCHRGGIPDSVKVLDFGLVREYRSSLGDRVQTTVASGVEGTPSFMPPEAIKNSAKSDPRSDIYSVGALGYFLLTNQYVFDAESVFELFEKHLTEPVVPPSRRTPNPISPELEEGLLRCLEKEPNLRPQSVLELRDLLLSSPRAGQWTLEARSAWWKEHATGVVPPTVKVDQAQLPPMEATVKIDFSSRM